MAGVLGASTLVEAPWLLATRSAGKVRELRPLFAAAGVRIETLADANVAEEVGEDAIESFDTFEANAIAKAHWFAARAGGRVVVAEDSGLEVDALFGAPGVRSKRWGEDGGWYVSGNADSDAARDEANTRRLLAELAAAALEGRTTRAARYVCVAACVWPGGAVVVRGETEGWIESAPSGGGGFGYDPVFRSTELGETFASVSQDAKGRVSHRGRAFAALLARLSANGFVGGEEVASDG